MTPEERKAYQEQYRKEHREKAREYAKQYRKEHPDRAHGSAKKYRSNHPTAQKTREWREKNPDKAREGRQRYYQDHAEEIKAWNREYAKANFKSGARWERNKRAWVDALGGKCTVCGDTDIRHLEIDHINNDGYKEGHFRISAPNYPVSMADPAKYQVLCANCHADKHWDFNHRGR